MALTGEGSDDGRRWSIEKRPVVMMMAHDTPRSAFDRLPDEIIEQYVGLSLFRTASMPIN